MDYELNKDYYLPGNHTLRYRNDKSPGIELHCELIYAELFYRGQCVHKTVVKDTERDIDRNHQSIVEELNKLI